MSYVTILRGSITPTASDGDIIDDDDVMSVTTRTLTNNPGLTKQQTVTTRNCYLVLDHVFPTPMLLKTKSANFRKESSLITAELCCSFSWVALALLLIRMRPYVETTADGEQRIRQL